MAALRWRLWLPIVLSAALLWGCDAGSARKPGRPDAEPGPAASTSGLDARILYYERRISRYPRSWALHAQLGAAQLVKARATYDPAWVTQARAAGERSLALQPNFEGFKLMARIANHGHRFSDALD